METINDIVINEFDICGYKPLAEFDECILMGATEGVDYWLISFNVKDYDIQKDLFDRVMSLSSSFSYIEKNLSLLLLANIDDKTNKDIDIVSIENDKSYFKKYVLKYNQKSVKELLGIMAEKNVNSISPLLQENQYFIQLREGAETMSSTLLLYSIAHKLPFIPMQLSQKERKVACLNLGSSELDDLLEWVNNAPTNEGEIERYITNSIIEDEEHKD